MLSPEKNSTHSVMCSHCLSLITNLPVPCTPCTLIRVSNPGNKTLRIQLCALSKTSLYPVLPVPSSESAILETKLCAFNSVLSLPEPYQKPPCTLYSLYLHPSQQSSKQNSGHSRKWHAWTPGSESAILETKLCAFYTSDRD